jgi:light-regulated signal transduction histidine kinase (bacteriophytochrome)
MICRNLFANSAALGEKLQDSAKDMLNEEQKNYLGRMLKATENMKHLIDSLLNFSLITQSEKKYEKVDLNLVLKQVLTEQELKIEETKATIEIEQLPTVEAVSSQMKQLFNNLIHNALKFSSKNQQPVIQITSKQASKKEIHDSGLLYNTNFYKIVVTDNGIGIDPRETEQIFQIFKRLHAKFEYSGSGIGLAICRKIIDYHKGIIYAESSMGKGASFSMILPDRQITYASF